MVYSVVIITFFSESNSHSMISKYSGSWCYVSMFCFAKCFCRTNLYSWREHFFVPRSWATKTQNHLKALRFRLYFHHQRSFRSLLRPSLRFREGPLVVSYLGTHFTHKGQPVLYCMRGPSQIFNVYFVNKMVLNKEKHYIFTRI